jgi:GT2 family glycosyltransferase
VNSPSRVRLVRVEVGGGLEAVPLNSKPGDRIWIEVSVRGRVVGVVEKSVEGVELPISILEELANEYLVADETIDQPITDIHLPKASVVVPTTFQRKDQLVRTIESILQLDYPDFEIVIVDNRPSANNVRSLKLSDPSRVRIVSEPRRGAASARNRGIDVSTGEFIAFTDDDVIVDRNWLRALGARFAIDDEVEAIGGMVRPTEIDTTPQLWFEEFYGGFTRSYLPRKWSTEIVGDSDPLFPYSAGHFGAGCNLAVRRTTAQRLGGFDSRLGVGTYSMAGEDLKLFIKVVMAGGAVAFEPAALVRHSHRTTSKEFMFQVFSYGIGLTAMYTSLVFDDRRQLKAILRRVPIGMKLLLFPLEKRSPSAVNSYPRRTDLFQLLGMACGPFAYALSVITSRRSKQTVI